MRRAGGCTKRACTGDPMSAEPLHVHYDVDGGNFTSAGEASVKVKRLLRQLGCSPETIRRVSIAMYEGEINMVIHANGGDADIYVDDKTIRIVLKDTGPGIKDVEQAMQEGYSTAPFRKFRNIFLFSSSNKVGILSLNLSLLNTRVSSHGSLK